MNRGPALPLEYGVAARALPGEQVSGDKHLVKAFPDGVLIAAIDGLGHGPEAAKAAEAAVAVLEANAQEAVVPLLQRCHLALKPTRGVAMSLASINRSARTMTWGGIGNVEAVLVRASGTGKRPKEALITRSGIVGYQVPAMTSSVLTLAQDDTLALSTDGIALGFETELALNDTPQSIADRILKKHAKENDDALVLIARWKGHGS